MSRLIHLNGPPRVGKSTLARRYGDEHPGGTVPDRGPDPAFEEAAQSAGAMYVQVPLLVDEEEHVRRLRGKHLATEVESRVKAALEDPSLDLVVRIRGQLEQYLDARPQTVRLDTTGLDEDATYGRLLEVLGSA